MSLGSTKDFQISDVTDTLQQLSAVLYAYAKEVVGSDAMVSEALAFGASGVRLVSDGELRDWNVITHMSRPSQAHSASLITTANCRGGTDDVSKIVCSDLELMRLDLEVGRTLTALRKVPNLALLVGSGDRWRDALKACADKTTLKTELNS